VQLVNLALVPVLSLMRFCGQFSLLLQLAAPLRSGHPLQPQILLDKPMPAAHDHVSCHIMSLSIIQAAHGMFTNYLHLGHGLSISCQGCCPSEDFPKARFCGAEGC
jgi:hypothetical protein